MSSKRKRAIHKKIDEFHNSTRKINSTSRCRKNKKQPLREASPDCSDSESEADPACATGDTSDDDFQDSKSLRTGRRLRPRRKRKFRIPSREEIWDKIPSTPFGRSDYTHLKPRKLVNNFTRENSRYNFDPAYTSGDDSIQDFVVPDDEISREGSGESDDSGNADSSDSKCSSTGSDGSSNQYGKIVKTRHRVNRNSLNKVKHEADQTDDTDNSEDTDSDNSKTIHKIDDTHNSEDTDSDNSKRLQNESDGSSNQYGQTLRKRGARRCRIQMLDSSSDSDSGNYLTTPPHTEERSDHQKTAATCISSDTRTVNNNNGDKPTGKQSVMHKALQNYIQSKQGRLWKPNTKKRSYSDKSSQSESSDNEEIRKSK